MGSAPRDAGAGSVRIEIAEGDSYGARDKKRIVTAMAAAGYEINMIEAEYLWLTHSESMCGTWLYLPEDDSQIVDKLRPYFRPMPGQEV